MQEITEILQEVSAMEISIRQIANKIDRDMSLNSISFCDRNFIFIEKHLENIKGKIKEIISCGAIKNGPSPP